MPAIKTSWTTRRLVVAAVIAALYAALTLLPYSLSYGPIQFRFAEALTVLPFLLPEAVPGLFIGCLVANLFSPYGLPDIVFGSLATLLAALVTVRCRKSWLAPLPPVIFTGLIIGALIYVQTGRAEAFWPTALLIAAEEAAVVFPLGLTLLYGMRKIQFFRREWSA